MTYSPEVKTHEVEQSETSGKDSAQCTADAKPASKRREGGGPVMNMVQPIRDEEALRKCFEIARAHDRARKSKGLSIVPGEAPKAFTWYA